MMKRLSPMDALFLYSESRETMMHVAGLLPFTPPDDAPPDFLREWVDEVRDERRIFSPWNLKLKTPDFMVNPVHHWVEGPTPDIDYHVRRSALPTPGDERELGVLVSRLHSNPVDFHRPPWEVHIIEGLERGRFAFYAKMHHALVDGFSAMRILARSMSPDPSARDTPFFFAISEGERAPRPEPVATGGNPIYAAVRAQLEVARDVTGVLRDMWRAVREGDTGIIGPLAAPKCVLNGRIGRNRRFATQNYPLDQIKAIAKAAGGTLNDVVLALSGAALRRFLQDLNALPDKPLVAMCPVNIRPKDDRGGGNAVGTILASLGTHLADPGARMEAIMASTRRAKEQIQNLSKNAILQLSAVMLMPSGLQQVLGMSGRVTPQFNVCISNVPGPERQLYFRGARLEGAYPVSVPVHGQALNITCQSYAGRLNFGFTGCRDTLPHMQRIAVQTGEALTELAKHYGVSA